MGGHIIPEKTNVGANSISVLVTALDGFALRQIYDLETNPADPRIWCQASNGYVVAGKTFPTHSPNPMR